VVEVGGKQLFVEPGKWYTCNRLKADVGAKIKFGRVLALKHDGKLTVGMPYLEKVDVEAEVIEELRGPKIIVYKMKPKKHYRRKQGHRWGREPDMHDQQVYVGMATAQCSSSQSRFLGAFPAGDHLLPLASWSQIQCVFNCSLQARPLQVPRHQD
jgi:ribosomal protein L21